MKTLLWIGALPQVQLVADGRTESVNLGTVVEVSDEAAESMIASGNWEEQGAPEPTPEPEPEPAEEN